MADGLQGLAYFPGIKQIFTWSFSMGHGAAPSVATFEIAPQQQIVQTFGTMEWVYGSTRFQMPDCKVDAASFLYDENNQIIRFAVMDRRWRWSMNNRLCGYFNIRRNSTTLVDGTEKPLRTLAKMCLDMMGEQNYDLGSLPNDPRPLVEWEYANPAAALQDLISPMGYRIVLSPLTNKVRLCKEGEGAVPPTGSPDMYATSATIDPPNKPEKIVIVGAPVKYQVDLVVQAVGMESTGLIQPLDKLSYTPTGGWKAADLPHFNNVKDQKDRELAQATVFKLYRVIGYYSQNGKKLFDNDNPFAPAQDKAPVNPKDKKMVDKDDQSLIKNIRQILPLGTEMCEEVPTDKLPPVQAAQNAKRCKPPLIYGMWYNYRLATEELLNTDTKLNPITDDSNDYAKKVRVNVGFSIDYDAGLITFSDFVFKLTRGDNKKIKVEGADLVLRTSIGIRQQETLAWKRHEEELLIGGPDSYGFLFIRREDVQRKVVLKYGDGFKVEKVEDNKKEASKQAKFYLDQEKVRFEVENPMTVDYIGFKRIDLDGAIQSVTWSLDEKGCWTRVQRNNDVTVYAPTWREQRYDQKVQQAVEQALKNPSVKAREAKDRPVT